nr:MAG TPA: hypothetical protein [Caudoviricetes sp.]
MPNERKRGIIYLVLDFEAFFREGLFYYLVFC